MKITNFAKTKSKNIFTNTKNKFDH